jgi:hypothetical protein
MSIRVMTSVWDGYPGGGTELLALLALADWSDDGAKCYPSIAAIARKTRLSECQARRVVHRLIDAGVLKVTANAMGGATSRRYQIILDRLTPSADATPSASARGSADATPPLAPVRGVPSHSYESRTVSEPSVHVKRTHRAHKTGLPVDFQISERVKSWAAKKGIGQLDEHLESFKGKCQAKGYTYADWDAAFMGAIREDWAKLRKPVLSGKRTPQAENFADRDYGKGGLI